MFCYGIKSLGTTAVFLSGLGHVWMSFMFRIQQSMQLAVFWGNESLCLCLKTMKGECWKERHPYLTFEIPPWDVGRQLSSCCSEADLPANTLPFAFNRRWDVSTSVELSLIHLSSSSSSQADLNSLHFRSHPASFRCSFSYFSFFVLFTASQGCSEVSLLKCSWYLGYQGHQSLCWYLQWNKSKFLLWGWPRRMWVSPLADDFGCLV